LKTKPVTAAKVVKVVKVVLAQDHTVTAVVVLAESLETAVTAEPFTIAMEV
jgi:hypothetical protein